MNRDPKGVALLALIYREQWQEGRTSLDDILADQQSCPGELSFLTLLAAERLNVTDWACLSALKRNGGDFLRLAREHPLRPMAEVLLHAKPPNGVQSKKLWAAEFRGERWDEVQLLMAALERSGTTTKHDDVEQTFSQAWREITGSDIDDYLDACEAA